MKQISLMTIRTDSLLTQETHYYSGTSLPIYEQHLSAVKSRLDGDRKFISRYVPT